MTEPNLDLPGLFGAPERRPVRFRVSIPLERRACRYCRAEIVWTVTATGQRMPLSWKTRQEVLDPATGKAVAWTMEAHFSDCPSQPKREPRRPQGAP